MPVLLTISTPRPSADVFDDLDEFVHAVAVLAGEVTNVHTTVTAACAMIFFWGRLAYAVIYVAGIPWLRTLAWFVSVIGMAAFNFQITLAALAKTVFNTGAASFGLVAPISSRCFAIA